MHRGRGAVGKRYSGPFGREATQGEELKTSDVDGDSLKSKASPFRNQAMCGD